MKTVTNSDCEKRAIISDTASFIIFVLTIIVIVLALLPNDNSTKELRVFFQDQGFRRSMENEILFLRVSLICALVSLSFYFIRLSLSLQLFDRLPKYYHKYISPLPSYARPVEWFIRLLILLFLLLGLQLGFANIANIFKELFAYEVIPSAYKFFEVTLFVFVLFSMFILWDIFYLTMWLVSRNVRNVIRFKALFKNFITAHLLGLFTWGVLLYIFGSKNAYSVYQPWLAILLFSAIVIQIYDNIRVLTVDRHLWKDTVKTYRNPYLFIFSTKIECKNRHAS